MHHKDGFYYGSCDEKEYRSLYLELGSCLFEVHPSTYLIAFQNSAECGFGIVPMGSDSWLLGDVFLRNYYSVWDHDNNRIGLVPHRTSQAQVTKVKR